MRPIFPGSFKEFFSKYENYDLHEIFIYSLQ